MTIPIWVYWVIIGGLLLLLWREREQRRQMVGVLPPRGPTVVLPAPTTGAPVTGAPAATPVAPSRLEHLTLSGSATIHVNGGQIDVTA
jgi:hypothetical protein